MHVYLIGFMGAGKSYDGRRLAKALNRPFIDLDDRLETAAGKTINALFAEDGEAAFRQLEAETLRSLVTEATAAVVATGGGAPCYHDNMEWMNANGTTVFLDPPVETLLARLEAGRAHRPLLHNATELRTFVTGKLAARRADYEQANIHLRSGDETGELVRLLMERPGFGARLSRTE